MNENDLFDHKYLYKMNVHDVYHPNLLSETHDLPTMKMPVTKTLSFLHIFQVKEHFCLKYSTLTVVYFAAMCLLQRRLSLICGKHCA